MESNDLRIFQAVAQTGSITKAAQTLGYVQSNVTARVQQLEAELNTKLFYRQRGMLLTQTGEKLVAYAERIIQLLDEAHRALADSTEPNGELAIGANQAVSTINLPQILARYHKNYPDVQLSLVTGQTDELVHKVLHFQLDGAFVKSPVKNDNIVAELEFEERLVFIAEPEVTDIREIYAKPFLMNSPSCPNRIQLEKWLEANSISKPRFMEFNNMDAIIGGVVAGLGVSFLPQSAIEKHEQAGRLKSFSVPQQYSLVKTFLIRHKDALLTNALAKFIEMVEASTP